MRAQVYVVESGSWDNSRKDVEFDRIPHIGECFRFGHKELYKVVMVVTNIDASASRRYDIYAVKTNLTEILFTIAL